MSFQDDFNQPKDRYFASEDLNFQSGDSPVVLDIDSSLGVPSIDGKLVCKSTSGSSGNILVELSNDGTNYGDQFTVFYLETFPLFGYSIKKIRITHSGTDSGYRVVAR
jgi:hypothetical protein